MSGNRRARSQDRPVAHVVERNISALIERRRYEARQRTAQERLADGVGRFAGSLAFVYIHLVLFGAWIAINVGAIPPIPRFDPTFTILGMAASVEAIFLSTFVLIMQNRMSEDADRRAELDLHISFLAEHEVTRILQLVTAIGQRLDIPQARDPELRELTRDVAPERLLDEIESRVERQPPANQSRPAERRAP